MLRLICGSVDDSAEIGGVVIHDPYDAPVLPTHALVLGIGVREIDEIRCLLDDLGASRAAALVVRAPVPVDPVLAEATRRSGVALLGLAPGASWNQLGALLRSLLAEDEVGRAEPETLGGVPSGDLFSVANAISALLDAPVTIEDRSSRVLAFSGDQDQADRSRTETILGRQVPDRYTSDLEARGVFSALYRSATPVRVDPWPDSEDFRVPRLALAVRAGEEVLGSIWAATDAPLTADLTRAFQESATLVALHLLRRRAGSDIARRLRADLIGRALDGGSGAVDAVQRLGLSNRAAIVIAMACGDSTADARSAGERGRLAAEQERLADAFAIHLGAVCPAAAVAELGAVVYAIVPVPERDPEAEERSGRLADAFLERIGERAPVSIGIGTVAEDVAALPDSRWAADRALRVARSGPGARRATRSSDVQVCALLLELRDLMTARRESLTGPIARLRAYDLAQHTSLVDTLRAWLDTFGDVNAAAAAVYIHPNTFRYRLRRITEIGRIDLTDPQARFAAMLQLRLMAAEADQP